MLHYAYRFASEAAAQAALAAAMPTDLDMIGRAYAPLVQDAEGAIVSGGAALPGWHVNAIWADDEPAAWASARIPHADAPRWWSGVARAASPVPPSLSDYQVAIDAHVEATARARSYNGAASCAGYSTSTVAAWAAEATAFIAWRDQVYLEAFETLAAVQGGAEPPSITALIAGLPAMVWPA